MEYLLVCVIVLFVVLVVLYLASISFSEVTLCKIFGIKSIRGVIKFETSLPGCDVSLFVKELIDKYNEEYKSSIILPALSDDLILVQSISDGVCVGEPYCMEFKRFCQIDDTDSKFKCYRSSRLNYIYQILPHIFDSIKFYSDDVEEPFDTWFDDEHQYVSLTISFPISVADCKFNRRKLSKREDLLRSLLKDIPYSEVVIEHYFYKL